MRKTLLFLMAMSFLACTSATPETTPTPTTPTGMDGIQKSNTANSSGELLNPEHGMPGHDCALPVGAPLNKGTKTEAEQKATAETKSPGAKQKLNPEHGMPDHDCALPVGAPLT